LWDLLLPVTGDNKSNFVKGIKLPLESDAGHFRVSDVQGIMCLIVAE